MDLNILKELRIFQGQRISLSCRLEFECTNNVAEYESLLQGLKKVVNVQVKEIKVFGYSNIIVR